MSDWLYPLSSKTDPITGRPKYHFKRSNGGLIPDTSPSSLGIIFKDGSVQGPWVVHLNRVNGRVSSKDRVWFYYGKADGALGVIAVGEVTRMDPDLGLSFQRKKAATRRLMSDPVPASVIRQYVQRPQTALWGIDKHPQLVKRLVKAAGF